MATFNDFLNVLKTDLAELAKGEWKDFKNEIIKDGTAFAEKTKEDLKRWTKLLLEGKLKADEVEFLVKGKTDLAEMEALKQAGLTLVKLNKLQNSIIDTVVGAIIKVFL